MENEIIKTGLQNPAIIPDILNSDILGMEDSPNTVKLKAVYQAYLKAKKMPSKSILNEEFGFDIDDANPADTEWIYQKLREHNQNYFDLAVRDLSELSFPMNTITPEKIHELEKRFIKDYGNKIANRIEISSPDDVVKLRERIGKKEKHFLQTCFPSINSLTKGNSQESTGGWHPGAIYAAVGLSGYGKSIILINFARDIWASEKNVLYISTEMDQDETFERILKSNFKSKNMDEVCLNIEAKTFPKSRIEVVKVHPNDTTCDDIQQMIDSLDWQPDILFIDYADELKSHESSNNEYEAQGVVYSGLKKLAEVNNLPLITATQTNRGAEDSEKGGTKDYVGYSAVADSSKKIRLVDMLFSITQSSAEKAEGVINLFVLKNRFGESHKKITFSINYQTMRLEELEQQTVVSSNVNNKTVISKSVSKTISEPKTLSVELNRRGKI